MPILLNGCARFAKKVKKSKKEGGKILNLLKKNNLNQIKFP